MREYLIPVTIAKLSSFIANPKQPTDYLENFYQAFYDAYRNSSEYRELKKQALEKIDYEIETTSN